MDSILETHHKLQVELDVRLDEVAGLQNKTLTLNAERLTLEKETLTLGTKSLALERESDNLDALLATMQSCPDPNLDNLPSLLTTNVRFAKSVQQQTRCISSNKRKFVDECDFLRSKVVRLISAKTALEQKPPPPLVESSDVEQVEGKLAEALTKLTRDQERLDLVLQVADESKLHVTQMQARLTRQNRETKGLNGTLSTLLSKILEVSASIASRKRRSSLSSFSDNPYSSNNDGIDGGEDETPPKRHPYKTPNKELTSPDRAPSFPKPRASRSRQRILDAFPVIGGLEESDSDEEELLFPSRQLFTPK